MTKSAKIKAVNRVFSLVKNGVNITEARQTVAEELGLSAGSTLWNWQRQLKMVTPNIHAGLTKVNNNTTVTRRITVDPSISATKKHLGKVLTSLVTKNGEFSTKEASAISQVSSGILGLNKHELEVAKFLNKNLIKTNKIV